MNEHAGGIKEQLWRLLPEVYRQKDRHAHLDLYLGAFGELLDLVYRTLQQRCADTALDTCQPWLIPYWADWLDVSLRSPTESGQREEIRNAVNWRQRKGRLQNCVEIAKHVGGFEVVPQEGHTRVAAMAAIGCPRPSLNALGEDPGLQPSATLSPSDLAKRPGTPAVTVDFRKIARAKKIDQPSAVSRLTAFESDQKPIHWQQPNRPLGIPWRLDGYQDLSIRTVDTRGPTYRCGHHHPKRLLLYAQVPEGFFTRQAQPVVEPIAVRMLIEKANQWQPAPEDWRIEPDGRPGCRKTWLLWGLELEEHRLDTSDPKTGIQSFDRYIVMRSAPQDPDENPPPGVVINGDVDLVAECACLTFENLVFMGKLNIACKHLKLERVAVRNLTQPDPYPLDIDAPLAEARDCLIDWLWLYRGVIQLEYCTLLNTLRAEIVQASDCIIMPQLPPDTCGRIWMRYCCAPRITKAPPESWRLYRVGRMTPRFYTQTFGQPGCGVLHPATDRAICFGAENGGELGGYHHRSYCLRAKAVTDKLRDFLPIGMEPVLLFDPSWQAPVDPQSEYKGA